MQDSIEDYIRIVGAQKDGKNILDKEKLAGYKAILECKKRAEEYAQTVVEFLIEGKLRPQIFLKSLNSLNETLYEDVVDERSITKLCGYPVCGNQIPDMPEKKYIILAKVNKIYDLTGRKKFCSNFCYKASAFIKKQIDSSPLWLRKPDSQCEYKLLPETNTGLTPGEELVNGIQLAQDESTFTSVSAFAEAALDNAEDNLPDEDIDKTKKDNKNHQFDQIKKSILKQNSYENRLEQINEEMEDNQSILKGTKKMHFIGTCTGDEKLKQQEELNASIQNICRSMNIKLGLNSSSQTSNTDLKTTGTSNQTTDDITIDYEKMNRVIEKVNESEQQRRKQPVLIDTKVNPEIPTNNWFVNKVKVPETPKYTQRVTEICNHTNISSISNDVQELVEKVKNPKINKTLQIAKVQDEKMLKILEKIKQKRAQDKKGVIIIDTVENPEVHKAHMQEIVGTQVSTPSHLKTYDCKEVLNAFSNWLTLDSLLFIHGEEKIKLAIGNNLDSHFNKINVSELKSVQQLKYLEICTRLDLKELHDKTYDSSCISTTSQSLRPIPDFETLKNELETTSLKAQAFFSGKIMVRTKDDKGNNDREVVLPLVDLSNTSVLRRNVFNKSILQYIKNHLFELSTPDSTFFRVQDFIKTFKFDANNIVFKPGQWNLIALILIHCLRGQDKHLQASEPTEYFRKYFLKLTHSSDLLTDLTSIIENFDVFIENLVLNDN